MTHIIGDTSKEQFPLPLRNLSVKALVSFPEALDLHWEILTRSCVPDEAPRSLIEVIDDDLNHWLSVQEGQETQKTGAQLVEVFVCRGTCFEPDHTSSDAIQVVADHLCDLRLDFDPRRPWLQLTIDGGDDLRLRLDLYTQGLLEMSKTFGE